MQYLAYLEQENEAFLNLKSEVQHSYNQRIQQQLQSTVWASGCKSWYMNANGMNTTLYPGLTLSFRKETKTFNPAIYEKVKTAGVFEINV
jgi:hypothetical protein